MEITQEQKNMGRQLLNKVPEITLFFWIIKILCTTVGETFADFINFNLNLGLMMTSILVSVLLIVSLVVQVRTNRYIPAIYWLAVALVSVVGTLITDNLTDNIGVPLTVSTAVFSVALAAAFGVWYASEKTLSIHSIYTRKRELFYWLVVLLTFALGTAVGDLLAEKMDLGYLVSACLFSAIIAAITFAHYRLKLNPIVSFWAAYILTRPLGASIGDLLAQPTSDGGLGLGTTVTSFIFLGLIFILVVYLTITRKDVTPKTRVDQPVVAEVADENN